MFLRIGRGVISVIDTKGSKNNRFRPIVQRRSSIKRERNGRKNFGKLVIWWIVFIVAGFCGLWGEFKLLGLNRRSAEKCTSPIFYCCDHLI